MYYHLVRGPQDGQAAVSRPGKTPRPLRRLAVPRPRCRCRSRRCCGNGAGSADRVRRAARAYRLLRKLCVDAEGWLTPVSSRTASPPSTCCPGPPPPSWPSSAPGASGARSAHPGRRLLFHRPRPDRHPGPVRLFLAPVLLRCGCSEPAAGAGRSRTGGRPPGRLGRSSSGQLEANRSPLQPDPLGRSTCASGRAAAATIGPWLVLVLLGCGLVEARGPATRRDGPVPTDVAGLFPLAALPASRRRWRRACGLAWVAFKVGALSYRRRVRDHPAHAARRRRHLPLDDRCPVPQRRRPRPVTPGPVVQTVAVVGYAAAGVAGGLLAALIAFTPIVRCSSSVGGPHFDQIRASAAVQAFLERGRRRRHRRDVGPPSPSPTNSPTPGTYPVLAGALVLLLPPPRRRPRSAVRRRDRRHPLSSSPAPSPLNQTSKVASRKRLPPPPDVAAPG